MHDGGVVVAHVAGVRVPAAVAAGVVRAVAEVLLITNHHTAPHCALVSTTKYHLLPLLSHSGRVLVVPSHASMKNCEAPLF